MSPETLLKLTNQAREQAEKTAMECDEHAQKVLDPEDFENYRELVTAFSGTLAMLAMVGKGAIFAEALATMNRIMADAEKGQKAWNEENPDSPA